MANTTILNKVIKHPDKDDLISKLIIDTPFQEINEWLTIKYQDVSDKKLILSEKELKSFKDNYLDVYQTIKEDMIQTQSNLVHQTSEEELSLTLASNPSYKELMVKTMEQEFDFKRSIIGLTAAVELRLGQIYDVIQQNPDSVNIKGMDRLFFEAVDKFGMIIERANKMVNQAPDQIIQHNVSVQHMDQHVSIFYEAIKKVLSQFDLETSMSFMESFNQELSKLKDPINQKITPVENRLAEVKILNEKINGAINEV